MQEVRSGCVKLSLGQISNGVAESKAARDAINLPTLLCLSEKNLQVSHRLKEQWKDKGGG